MVKEGKITNDKSNVRMEKRECGGQKYLKSKYLC
jgi:hypothetical protein